MSNIRGCHPLKTKTAERKKSFGSLAVPVGGIHDFASPLYSGFAFSRMEKHISGKNAAPLKFLNYILHTFQGDFKGM